MHHGHHLQGVQNPQTLSKAELFQRHAAAGFSHHHNQFQSVRRSNFHKLNSWNAGFGKMLAKLFGFPTRFAQTKIESDFEQQVSKFGFEICANYLVLPDMKSMHLYACAMVQ